MADGFLTVPFKVEGDGKKTFFLPECRMGKGYEIGTRDKDKGRGTLCYWEVLDKPMAMSLSRFSRKSKSAIFGAVNCEPGDVEQVSKAFIEQERVKHGG